MADIKGVTNSIYSGTYTSFSGIDIKASVTVPKVDKEGNTVLTPIVLGTLQAISFSVTREKAPIYTMGSADPRSFSRGKRGIAGSLIFITFDRHALYQIMAKSAYAAKDDDIKSPADLGDAASGSHTADIRVVRPIYADQIPAFDITLTGINEYGQVAQMKILGVEILNEGNGISVDDIVNEAQMTFVARRIINWTPVVEKREEFDTLNNKTLKMSGILQNGIAIEASAPTGAFSGSDTDLLAALPTGEVTSAEFEAALK